MILYVFLRVMLRVGYAHNGSRENTYQNYRTWLRGPVPAVPVESLESGAITVPRACIIRCAWRRILFSAMT